MTAPHHIAARQTYTAGTPQDWLPRTPSHRWSPPNTQHSPSASPKPFGRTFSQWFQHSHSTQQSRPQCSPHRAAVKPCPPCEGAATVTQTSWPGLVGVEAPHRPARGEKSAVGPLEFQQRKDRNRGSATFSRMNPTQKEERPHPPWSRRLHLAQLASGGPQTSALSNPRA